MLSSCYLVFIFVFLIVFIVEGICISCNNNNNNNNNNNSSPEILRYRVGIRWGIVCPMGRKKSSALGGSLSRDGVSIKRLNLLIESANK